MATKSLPLRLIDSVYVACKGLHSAPLVSFSTSVSMLSNDTERITSDHVSSACLRLSLGVFVCSPELDISRPYSLVHGFQVFVMRGRDVIVAHMITKVWDYCYQCETLMAFVLIWSMIIRSKQYITSQQRAAHAGESFRHSY